MVICLERGTDLHVAQLFVANRKHVCFVLYIVTGGSVAEWLVCWTQAQKGPG